jgi:hypothetical protein
MNAFVSKQRLWSARRAAATLCGSVMMLLVAAAGRAIAGEFTAQVTIDAGKTYNSPSHDYYEVAACPIADFDVAVAVSAYFFSGSGLGNASDSIYNCVDVSGPNGVSSSFQVLNPDTSHDRTFDVFGFYSGN